MKTHCIQCGSLHAQNSYPKKCLQCNTEAYQNPIPVVVVLVPVKGEGVLVIQRGIEPQKGNWALPGGYMELGETMEEAGIREVFEETSLKVTNLKHFMQANSSNGKTVLSFFVSDPISKKDLPSFRSFETLDIKSTKKADLCFPSHQKAFDQFMKDQLIINLKYLTLLACFGAGVGAALGILYFKLFVA